MKGQGTGGGKIITLVKVVSLATPKVLQCLAPNGYILTFMGLQIAEKYICGNYAPSDTE